MPEWLAANAPAEVNYALGAERAGEALGEEEDVFLPENQPPGKRIYAAPQGNEGALPMPARILRRGHRPSRPVRGRAGRRPLRPLDVPEATDRGESGSDNLFFQVVDFLVRGGLRTRTTRGWTPAPRPRLSCRAHRAAGEPAAGGEGDAKVIAKAAPRLAAPHAPQAPPPPAPGSSWPRQQRSPLPATLPPKSRSRLMRFG